MYHLNRALSLVNFWIPGAWLSENFLCGVYSAFDTLFPSLLFTLANSAPQVYCTWLLSSLQYYTDSTQGSCIIFIIIIMNQALLISLLFRWPSCCCLRCWRRMTWGMVWLWISPVAPVNSSLPCSCAMEPLRYGDIHLHVHAHVHVP